MIRRPRLLATTAALALAAAASLPGPASAQQRPTRPAPHLIQFGTPKAGLPNVIVVGIGGTIVSSAVARDRWQSYGGDQGINDSILISRVMPELGDVANVSNIEISNLGSGAIKAEDMYNTTRAVDAALAEADAVVVLAGTNIMEEVAYWLDLTVRSDNPVVITGSMRQNNTFSFDGLANLFNSVVLAASGKTTCYGTVLLLNDEFMAAREVRKTDAVRINTFEGGDSGVLGAVDERRVRAIQAPARVLKCGTPDWRTPFDMSTITPQQLPKVEIEYSYMDAGRESIDGMVAAGAKGIVTAGHGAGNISTAQTAARNDAVKKGVVFVNTTRTGSGPVWGGGEGVLAGMDLMPQKARILLQLALAFGKDEAQVRQLFETIGLPDFDMSRRPRPTSTSAAAGR
ncbi:MAG: asparaginase [Gemmatimonadetes bacterium]|nr:asparaginase [Gemmatimonadota bacterium]